MPIPLKRLNALRTGRSLAAEVPASGPDRRAFVVVSPMCPTRYEQPDAWLYTDRQYGNVAPTPVLRSPAFIEGFALVRIEHDAKYNERDYYNDPDLALYDETTRARYRIVETENEIEPALAVWLPDASELGPPQNCDSALAGDPFLARWVMNQEEALAHLAL